MEEWRVHVGIKLVRAQLGLERWNEDRADKPADCMVPKHPRPEKAKKEQPAEEVKEEQPSPEAETVPAETPEPVAVAAEEAPAKPKRGRKPKVKDEE